MYCHGHSQVSSSLAAHLAIRPLSLSRRTMTSGRPNGKCIAAVVDEHTVTQNGVVL